MKSEGDDEAFIFDLAPEYVIWSRDGKGNAKVKRRGFRIIPDFAGTAHAYCGDTLPTLIGDLLKWSHIPTLENAERAYIIKSRVRDAENLLLAQPYKI